MLSRLSVGHEILKLFDGRLLKAIDEYSLNHPIAQGSYPAAYMFTKSQDKLNTLTLYNNFLAKKLSRETLTQPFKNETGEEFSLEKVFAATEIGQNLLTDVFNLKN